MFSNNLSAEGLKFAVTVWLSMLPSLRNFATTRFPYAFPRLKAEELKAAKRERDKQWRENMKKIYSLGKSETPQANTAKPAAVRITSAERHSPHATAHKPSAAKPKAPASSPFKPPATTANGAAKEAPQSSGAKVHVPFRIVTYVHPVVARLTCPSMCFPFCRQHLVLRRQPLSSTSWMKPQRFLTPSTRLSSIHRF